VGGYAEAGHAYVFNANTGAVIQTLASPNAQGYGYFGYSVAVSGKLVLVGSPDETAGGYTYAGHVYVLNAHSGKLVRTLTSPNAQSGGGFGESVAVSGKVAVEGAPYETAHGHSAAGHAYVLRA
jgi:outer membrane protein assembly factor BamB